MAPTTCAASRVATRATAALTLALVIMVGAASVALAAGRTWASVAEDTTEYLTQAAKAYESGSTGDAKKLVDKAYFGPFEEDGMEATIKNYISAQRAFELEQEFKQIKIAMGAGASPQAVARRVKALSADLAEDAATLDGTSSRGASAGGATPFLQSFGILLREGFEAILILGAIVAYLRKSGDVRSVRVVQVGALAAVVASILVAVVLSSLLASIGGLAQEVLEGATMLVAVAVLLWVSLWLAGKTRARQWQDYIQGQVERSASRGSTLALASVAFLAVFREGGETILFYTALVSGNRDAFGAMALGFGAAALALVALYGVLRWGSMRIPFRPFFIATSGLLFYMAFVFAGQGIRELQGAGVVGARVVAQVPVVDLLGIYPTVESLVTQAVLLALAVGVAIWQWRSGGAGTDKGVQQAGGTS